MDEKPSKADGVPSDRPDVSLRVTQVFGLCFYWAWVYLSFNTTSSINLNLVSDQSLLWVHLASMLVGVITYALIIAFSREAMQRFSSRRSLIIAGCAMSVGTACYALPLGLPLPALIIGAGITGLTSCWIVVYWGTLFSELSARGIVLSTAAAFFCANVIYFGSLLLPPALVGIVTGVMPLCASLLLPDDSSVRSLLQPGRHDVAATSAGESARTTTTVRDAGGDREDGGRASHQLVPLARLPWRVAGGLFVVMVVYGGVRVFIGVSDATVNDGLLPTVLLTFGVSVVFVIWGVFFQGENASLGTVYKILLPLLATALLMMVLFGQEYVGLMAVLATVCDTTIEILSWILLADIARTTRVPALLVFSLGRMAVQGGMFVGQLTSWVLIDSIIPFAVVSVFGLMLVMGFMFKDQDTLLIFEAPSADERDTVEKLTGRPMDEHLSEIARERGLTQRETEIFMLWATGHGSRYIQDTLTISGATVKTHVRHIYEKFGVHNRAEVLALLERRDQSR